MEPMSESWKQTLQKAQIEDEDLQIAEDWGEKPPWEEVAPESEGVKYLWSRWTNLEKRDGLCYYRWEMADGTKQWKVWIPKARSLKEYHDGRMASHFGIERTLARIKKSPYFWPKLCESVEDWCISVTCASRSSQPTRNRRH